MSTSFEHEYKVVIAIKDVVSEKPFKNDLDCKISIADQLLVNKIPLKEAITLDVKDLQKYGFCDIQFEQKSRNLGKIRVLIPNQIENKNEIEIEENFNIYADDKKTLELKGKYLIVILNKKFFNKKKVPETIITPKNLVQSEVILDKKQTSNEKKKGQPINKLYASASPSTLKSQKKESNQKNEEPANSQVLLHSEKLETTANETPIKTEFMKTEVIKTETRTESTKIETKKPEETKFESKKSEELEQVINSPKPQKLSSTQSSDLKKKNQPGHKKGKKEKNAELLDNLIDKACETQGVEKKYLDDMEKIEECVYLTKLKNLEEKKDVQDSENTDSARIRKILNSSFDMNKDYRENFDISPEGLAKKYEKNEEKTNDKSLNNSNSATKKSKFNERKRFYSPNASFKNNTIAVDNTETSAVLLENEVWRYVKNYENQINYLKIMVYALDKKLADYNSIKKENDLLKLELRKNEDSRKDLQGTIKQTTDEMKNEIKQLHTNYNQIIAEKNDYIDKMKVHENKVFELLDLNDKLEHSKRKVEDELNESSLKLRGYNELKAQYDITKNQQLNGEKKQTEIQNNFSNKLKEINQFIQSLEKQNKDLIHEKNDLKQEINELKNSLNNTSNVIAEKNSEIDSLKRKLQINQGYDLLIKNLNDQITSLTKQLEDKKLELDGAYHSMESVKNDCAAAQKMVSNREKKLTDQNQILEKQLIKQDIKINGLTDQLTNLQSKNSEIKTSLSSLEQLVCIKEDLRKQLDFSNEKVDNLTKDKENLLNKINELFDQITHHGHKLLDTSNIINHLKDFLSQKENYCNNLKKLILEMREKGGYVPFKDDPIDNKLADYINGMNFTDSNLKILFIREGEGVYQFGTKRVYVTIHQDKINIRVGGGFMKIENFVESYTPLELEKLKRKDPVKIFNTNLAVNKTIAGRMVHEFEKMHTSEMKPEKFNNVFRMVKKNE